MTSRNKTVCSVVNKMYKKTNVRTVTKSTKQISNCLTFMHFKPNLPFNAPITSHPFALNQEPSNFCAAKESSINNTRNLDLGDLFSYTMLSLFFVVNLENVCES